MKKVKYIPLGIALVIATILLIYMYVNQSYICNSRVESKTTYLSSLSPDEVNKYNLSFGFSWNEITKKIKISSIDELSMVDFHLQVHYAAIENSRKHNSFISSDEMGVYFGSDHDAFRHETKDSFSYESSSLNFDKKSKYIVITKLENSQISRSAPSVSRNVKISGHCSRQLFN